jgi:large repetitive protein
VNHPYSRTFTASGGSSPYTFLVESGDQLPNGLTLSPAGVLSGTPTTDGSFYFTIVATDSYGCTGRHDYFLYINPCPSITLSPATLPNAKVGQSYNRTMTASGGSSPYTFVVANGNLPTGLTLSSGGVLSGTPTASGPFGFTIVVRDTYGCAGKRQYTLVVTRN